MPVLQKLKEGQHCMYLLALVLEVMVMPGKSAFRVLGKKRSLVIHILRVWRAEWENRYIGGDIFAV